MMTARIPVTAVFGAWLLCGCAQQQPAGPKEGDDKVDAQAKEAAGHFMKALRAKDLEAVMKTIDVPFVLGEKKLAEHEALRKHFGTVIKEEKLLTEHEFEIREVHPFEKIMGKLDKLASEVLDKRDRVVILEVKSQGKPMRVAILVRLRDGKADPVDLADVPTTIAEALGEELTEPHQVVRSIPGQTSMHHGRGQRKDEIEFDMVRFFRVIDRAILEHHSRPSGLPLVLVALPEYHAPFRELSHNPFLLGDGIPMNPEALSQDQMRVQAWQKMEPLYLKRLANLIENYQLARSRQLGSDNLTQVAQATMAGRVGTLLVEADREIPGKIDPATGRIERGDLSHPEIDDILDDLAETVLRMKGEVVVVPAERMPSVTGVAATYRF